MKVPGKYLQDKRRDSLEEREHVKRQLEDQSNKRKPNKRQLERLVGWGGFSPQEDLDSILVRVDLIISSLSRYNEVRLLMEGTKNHVTAIMQVDEAEDRSRGVYTFQVAPASLLSGKDAQLQL